MSKKAIDPTTPLTRVRRHAVDSIIERARESERGLGVERHHLLGRRENGKEGRRPEVQEQEEKKGRST